MGGVNRFDQLIAWQRMHELSVEVWKATANGPAARDFRCRDQIHDAADSAARNIAEGFGRFTPAEFARFLDISRASALETQSVLRKLLAVGCLNEPDYARLNALAERGIQAVARLQKYLRSPRAKCNAAACRRHID